MQIKRLEQEELKNKLIEIVYDYLANDNKTYFQQSVKEEGKNVPSLIFKENEQLAKDIRYRINYFNDCIAESDSESDKDTYRQANKILEEELERVTNLSIEKHKAMYEKTHDVYMSTTAVIIPLNKKINAFYDDFNIFVAFYDGLSNAESIKQFNKLRSKEKKIQFVKDHIEITHIFMSLSDSSHANIAILGNFNEQYTDPTSSSAEILPPNYSDFANTTLADCENIVNNDLKQMIQERIDMDKENLKVVAERNVRGDLYKILKSENSGDEYIRYVCPSTQRVYYNLLNKQYLSESEYFHEGDYDSYILAWYSINNLFMELDEEALAVVTPRC